MARKTIVEGIRVTKVGVLSILVALIVGVAAANTGNNALYIFEALLLWGLQQKPVPEIGQAVSKLLQAKILTKTLDPGSLSSWSLPEYVDVAAELNLITATTATQSKLVKDFRNLIHPGRSVRLGQICNRGTALSAVAGVELVIQDLTRP